MQPEPSRVSWSPKAIRELELTVKDRSVQEELKRNAELTLHEIPERGDEDRGGHCADEGRIGAIMWHRGWTHEQERRAEWEPEDPADDGPWNYVLFYRSAPEPGAFTVLAVRGCVQIADCWYQMNDDQAPGR